MVSSVATTLGYGSGLDISKLVTDLAAASRDPKVARFDARTRAVQASISAVAQARSDLDGFATSLAALVAEGSLQAQPTVSDTTLLDAKPKAGARLGNFSGEVEVLRLARGQTSVSGFAASATVPVGQGALTLTVGGTATAIAIGPAQDSFDGLAAAINAARVGVTASVVNDTGGTRLVLKGATGSASAFSLSSSDPALAGFAGGVSQVQAAQDAQIRVDGIAYVRAANSIDDVAPGMVLTLKRAAPGSVASIGVSRTPDKLKATLGDFVSVYNELHGHIAEARTATRGDRGLQALDRQLSGLLTRAVSSGTPAGLSAIGIRTNRDGTITLDELAFTTAWTADPDGVEAIFLPTRDAMHTAVTDPGIGGALAAIRTAADATDGPLKSLTTRLGKEAEAIAKDRMTMEAREAAYKTRLERQFGGIDGRVGALKATQSYLDQQIAMWTKST